MRKKCLGIWMLVAMLVATMTGCATRSETKQTNQSGLVNKLPNFSVTSDSVNSHGVLKRECCYFDATPKGDNVSPQLSWDDVKGAKTYAVYMYDLDAKNYLHWRVADLTDTSIPEGIMKKETMYVGPYPPEGTHHYQITVYAMKKEPTYFEGKINSYTDIDAVESHLNEDDKNVIAVGTLMCTVTSGK